MESRRRGVTPTTLALEKAGHLGEVTKASVLDHWLSALQTKLETRLLRGAYYMFCSHSQYLGILSIQEYLWVH